MPFDSVTRLLIRVKNFDDRKAFTVVFTTSFRACAQTLLLVFPVQIPIYLAVLISYGVEFWPFP